MALKIKNAINHYNDKRGKGQPKMTLTSLGKILFPNYSKQTAGWYLSQWNDGLNEGKLKPNEILTIKESTGVSLNFLFGLPDY